MIGCFKKETGSDRTYNSIMSKWKTKIHGLVANYCAIMDNVKYTHGSGENDADDKDKALMEYRVRYGHDFNLLECWEILRSHDAWKKEMPIFQSGSRKKSKGSTTTLGSTQGPLNFQDLDDNDDTEDDTGESRPQGCNAARKKSSSSSLDPPQSWTSSLASNFWRLKPSKSSKSEKNKSVKSREKHSRKKS